jgi:hypothetical protein
MNKKRIVAKVHDCQVVTFGPDQFSAWLDRRAARRDACERRAGRCTSSRLRFRSGARGRSGAGAAGLAPAPLPPRFRDRVTHGLCRAFSRTVSLRARRCLSGAAKPEELKPRARCAPSPRAYGERGGARGSSGSSLTPVAQVVRAQSSHRGQKRFTVPDSVRGLSGVGACAMHLLRGECFALAQTSIPAAPIR